LLRSESGEKGQVAQMGLEQIREAARKALAQGGGSRLGSSRLVAEDQLVQQVTISAMHKFDLSATKLNL
jgi:hypothetical protein